MSGKIIKYVVLVFLIVLGVWGYWRFQTVTINSIILGDQKVKVTVVSSPEDLARGLAGVKDLPEDQGMLFLFPKQSEYRFWMKDMLIPLDIIWLRGEQIVDISANVRPPVDLANQTDLPLYSSSEPVDSVLELRSGFSQRHGVKVGDTVKFE